MHLTLDYNARDRIRVLDSRRKMVFLAMRDIHSSVIYVNPIKFATFRILSGPYVSIVHCLGKAGVAQISNIYLILIGNYNTNQNTRNSHEMYGREINWRRKKIEQYRLSIATT